MFCDFLPQIGAMNEKGMTVNDKNPTILYEEDVSRQGGDVLDAAVRSARGGQLQLILCIKAAKDQDQYGYIKRMAETQLGIMTQVNLYVDSLYLLGAVLSKREGELIEH